MEENSKQLLKSNKIQTIKDIILEDKISEDAKNELNKIIEIEKTIARKKLIYKTKNKSYSFKNFRTIRVLGNDIYNGMITLEESDKDQGSLVNEINRSNGSTRYKMLEKRQNKKDTLENLKALYTGRQKVLDAFQSGIFSINKTEETGFPDHRQSNLKILTPIQMLQRLPIVLAQVKAGNTSENLLNEIRQIVYSLYRAKEITKKVYNNIIKSI